MYSEEPSTPGDDLQKLVHYRNLSPEAVDVVLVDEGVLLEAQGYLDACEHCAPNAAAMTFDYLLDAVTGSDPTLTEYLMWRPARCPRCRREVTEKTLVVA